MGRRLIPELLKRKHVVRALARAGSEGKLPPGCELVSGNVLEAGSFADRIQPADTFVHLVGVSHPSPAKAEQFRKIDYVSAREAFAAAKASGINHFVYVSVAHPARTMKTYAGVRMECEELLRQTGMNATILQPWYVLGPGHRWPLLVKPVYWLLERFPSTRESAQRLGLISLREMINALVWSIENPTAKERIIDVPGMRQLPVVIS